VFGRSKFMTLLGIHAVLVNAKCARPY